MGKVLFFGYGANRSQQKISEIIGRDPGLGIGAILENYTLNIQNLTQIPNPPQTFLGKIYGSDFKSYTVKKGAGIVLGDVWELEEKEWERIKEWEFVGVTKWREPIEVEVTTSTGEKVKAITEKSSDEYSTTFIVDGLTYNLFGFISKAPNNNTKTPEYYTQKQITEIRKWLTEQSSKK